MCTNLLLLRQYLYLCTSKACKPRGKRAEEDANEPPADREVPAQKANMHRRRRCSKEEASQHVKQQVKQQVKKANMQARTAAAAAAAAAGAAAAAASAAVSKEASRSK
jgi:hypothetical protein